MANQPVVAVSHLKAGYGTQDILDDINVRVFAGEVRVILGASGCGKSTLLRHMIGLSRPRLGTVELLGCDLADAPESVREHTLSRIGMLFQSGAMLNSLTVLENVALPLKERTLLPHPLIYDIAMTKLMLVGMADAAFKYPPELSGGMKKRAALARAIALDPEVLFCDEPGAGLDPVMAADLDQLIIDLRNQFGMAVVIVTHELLSIRAVADKVLMLHQGRVAAEGTLDDVMQTKSPVVQNFFLRKAQRKAQLPSTLLQALGHKEP